MIVTRKGFRGLVNAVFGGSGFPADAATVEFPAQMFLADGDLSPIKESIDKIAYGLTKWKPAIEEKKMYASAKITVEGKDYQEAVTNMNLLFLRNQWGDGLPILPAPEERVNWILTGTDLPRDKVIDKIVPRGGIATIEQIAVALDMSGGRPEYLPVLIAAVEALVDPLSRYADMATTTGSNYPVVIVSGPIAKQIRINSGYGCLGPDPNHPAGAGIGRALRLLQMDLGGAIPGAGTMSIYGGANRYTNIVFAEDEEGIPQGWEPLGVERGFPKGSNVVTIHFANATINMHGADTSTGQGAMQVLHKWAGYIGIPNANYWSTLPRWENGSPGILLMPRGTARGLDELGWSKDKIRNLLWVESKLPPSKVKDYGFERVAQALSLDPTMPMPVSKTPKSLTIVVAGGEQSGHAYFMPNQGNTPMSREIKLPTEWKWNDLLKQAQIDLGSIPDR